MHFPEVGPARDHAAAIAAVLLPITDSAVMGITKLSIRMRDAGGWPNPAMVAARP
jgi:hypothetical protein